MRGVEKNWAPCSQSSGIIYKSSASPSCIRRLFTAWHMLRPHASVSAHEGRFAIGLETGERQGKRFLSDGDADGGKIQVWRNISTFSLCLIWDQDIGWNLMHCEDTSWATGLEEYKLYTRALQTVKTPWLNHACCDAHWDCERFCWEGVSKREIEVAAE